MHVRVHHSWSFQLGACSPLPLTPIPLAMTLAEALETTRIHRVAGLTGARTTLVTTRPCRAPPHTIAEVGRIGGGQVPRPGEVSLAHHGVLFLDERPEFRRHVLEVLRQPLDRVSYKYNFQSVLKSNDFFTLALRLRTESRSG